MRSMHPTSSAPSTLTRQIPDGDLTHAQKQVFGLLSLMFVFLSGTLVGAVSYRLYMVNTVSERVPPGRARKYSIPKKFANGASMRCARKSSWTTIRSPS